MKGRDKGFLRTPLFYYFSAFIKFKHNKKTLVLLFQENSNQFIFFFKTNLKLVNYQIAIRKC
jgi:hypothetical protein